MPVIKMRNVFRTQKNTIVNRGKSVVKCACKGPEIVPHTNLQKTPAFSRSGTIMQKTFTEKHPSLNFTPY